MDREKYFVALTDSNGYHWVTFRAYPHEATADQTGFVAVGQSFETKAAAEEKAAELNWTMFKLDTAAA